MKIFITGASGFVGSTVVQKLKSRHSFVALSRSEKSDATLRELGAAPVRGELGKITADMLKGVDAVVHSAAHVEDWGKKVDFWRVNVTGTEQLLEVARSAGIAKFIFIGTEAALFHGQDMLSIDETYPYPKKTPYLYSLTKGEAEKRVIAAKTTAFKTISLRPRLIWGPGDKTILPVLIEMIRLKRFMWMDNGAKATSTTHIYNLVHAIDLALKADRGGEAYFVSDGEETTFRDFLTRYLATQGIVPPAKSISGGIARAIAFVAEGIWRLFAFKSDPPLTRFAAAILSSHCTVRIDKIRRDLGYRPEISVATGLDTMPRLPQT